MDLLIIKNKLKKKGKKFFFPLIFFPFIIKMI
jgi:hypothetical protein